jgi:hypothetical protein
VVLLGVKTFQSSRTIQDKMQRPKSSAQSFAESAMVLRIFWKGALVVARNCRPMLRAMLKSRNGFLKNE